MSQLITTGNTPKAMWPGVKAWFGQAYEEHTPEYTDLFDQDTSDKAYEEVVESHGFSLPSVKPEGQSVTYSTTSQGYTTRFTHVAWANGFMVSFEEMRDNLYAEVSKRRAPDLAFSMRQGHEQNCADFYNDGFTTNHAAEGVPWFSASHPTPTGNQSNLLTAADLSETSLEDAGIQVMQALDSMGRKIGLKMQSLHIAPANWYEANRILKSINQNDTANNAINVLRVTGEFPKGIKVNHWFDDADAYYIRTNARRGAMHFQRDPLDFAEDGAFDNKAQKYMAYERYVVGRADWRGTFGNRGA
jgi:hypothetical protein